MKAVSDTFRGNSRKNDKQKRQHPKNGGLDVLKTAAVLENPLWAHEATCPATVFFFPRLAGQDRLAYSVLVLLLFGCLFQPV